MKFGRLEAVNKDTVYYSEAGNPRTNWICRCECGKTVSVNISKLRNGHTKSCGCLQKEKASESTFKHGFNKGKGMRKKEYNSWAGMRNRCNNKKNGKYPIYGARGIKVCERWNDFNNFINDMGMAPTKNHSIDRINNNGDYEPGNCRWATKIEQSNNQRSTNFYEAEGVSMPASQWAEHFGVSRWVIVNRIKRGASFESVHAYLSGKVSLLTS